MSFSQPSVVPAGAGKRRFRRIVTLAVIAAAGGGLWLLTAGKEKAPARDKPLPPVLVTTVRQGDVSRHDRSTGTILPLASVQVRSRVEGQVQDCLVRDGQQVEAGQLLFRLDPRPFQAALDQAEGILVRDEAQLASARADLSRYSSLSQKGYASSQQFEQASAQARALAGTVAADRAAVEMARLNLGYSEIRAPVAGRVGAILIDPGNVVRANDASVLVELTTDNPVRVRLTLPQPLVPALHQAQAAGPVPLSVQVRGDSGPPLETVIDYVAPRIQETTGTLELRATLANPDGRLVPGQFVETSLRLALLPGVLTVPLEAVNHSQQGPYIYTVDDSNTARRRQVEVVWQEDGQVVIAPSPASPAPSGASPLPPLAAGERVIVDGQLRVRPDGKVQVRSGLLDGIPGAAAAAAGKGGVGKESAGEAKAGETKQGETKQGETKQGEAKSGEPGAGKNSAGGAGK